MDAAMLIGAIIVVVSGVHVLSQFMLANGEPTSWRSRRAWVRSALFGGLFFVLCWLMPLGICAVVHPAKRSPTALLLVLCGMVVYAAVLGRSIRRDSVRRAGLFFGFVATVTLAVLVFIWVTVVGMYFLGPGLN
jgi:hypothetical protein